MKLLVFSDAHGRRERLESILGEHRDADMVISLGDTAVKSAFLQAHDIIAIKGNHPFDAGMALEHVVTVAGKKILLTHGHKHKVQKGIEKLSFHAKLKGVDIALYGHTHVASHDVVDGIHLINPGAVSKSRDHNPESYAIITLKDDTTHVAWHHATTHEPIHDITFP